MKEMFIQFMSNTTFLYIYYTYLLLKWVHILRILLYLLALHQQFQEHIIIQTQISIDIIQLLKNSTCTTCSLHIVHASLHLAHKVNSYMCNTRFIVLNIHTPLQNTQNQRINAQYAHRMMYMFSLFLYTKVNSSSTIHDQTQFFYIQIDFEFSEISKINRHVHFTYSFFIDQLCLLCFLIHPNYKFFVVLGAPPQKYSHFQFDFSYQLPMDQTHTVCTYV
eukprot:TRINITY_DN3052_c0_g1_i3.p1 TRINITY_DN3052_c0_g1~~TRINITY_DN3052_c0_g1_i3.p1  ORF type:complete len:220 (-),score=-27.47 TRINITY_DN3052_c0_g1_i3:125-784(-)